MKIQRDFRDLLKKELSSLNESDLLVAFGIGRVFDLCMEELPTSWDLLVDNSESVRGSAEESGRNFPSIVHKPDSLKSLDPSKLVIVIFSAQGWDIEDQLNSYGIPRERVFNFAEFEPFRKVLFEIPREQAFYALPSLVADSDTCLDIGACEGLYSIMMASLCSPSKGGRVFAFEPYSRSREALFRNIKAAGVGGITVSPFALGSGSTKRHVRIGAPRVGSHVKAGSATILSSAGGGNPSDDWFPRTPDFVISEDDPDFRTSQWSNPAPTDWLSEIVEQTTLDSFFAGHEVVDFVKIDVEGYEMEVLLGAKRLISKCRPKILIEATSGTSALNSIIDFLSPLGYQKAAIENYVDTRSYSKLALQDSHQNHLFIPPMNTQSSH